MPQSPFAATEPARHAEQMPAFLTPHPWQDMVEERQKGGDAPCTNPLEAD